MQVLIHSAMNTSNFLTLLRERGISPKKTTSGWEVKCPARDNDPNPNLRIGEGRDGRVLLRCRWGCSIEAIFGAMNIKKSDWFVDQPKPANQQNR
jgi:hypothetical protein